MPILINFQLLWALRRIDKCEFTIDFKENIAIKNSSTIIERNKLNDENFQDNVKIDAQFEWWILYFKLLVNYQK